MLVRSLGLVMGPPSSLSVHYFTETRTHVGVVLIRKSHLSAVAILIRLSSAGTSRSRTSFPLIVSNCYSVVDAYELALTFNVRILRQFAGLRNANFAITLVGFSTTTERRGRVVNTPDSYLGGLGFKSRSGDRLH
jgi:hypothetical protein